MTALPFIVTYLLLAPHAAHAYLDPGSGSLVIQVVIAFFVGVGFAAKQNWMRFRSVFRRKTPVPNTAEGTVSEKEPGRDA